jgi:hypothetical protein
MKKRIIEICELGNGPQAIIHREGEPISELIFVEDLVEELNQQLLQHGVMQAEGSDGAEGAAVGQRSVGTNAEAVADFKCYESDKRMCAYQCDECKLKERAEAPSEGHL